MLIWFVFSYFTVTITVRVSAYHDLNRFKPETRFNTPAQYLVQGKIWSLSLYDHISLYVSYYGKFLFVTHELFEAFVKRLF